MDMIDKVLSYGHSRAMRIRPFPLFEAKGEPGWVGGPRRTFGGPLPKGGGTVVDPNNPDNTHTLTDFHNEKLKTPAGVADDAQDHVHHAAVLRNAGQLSAGDYRRINDLANHLTDNHDKMELGDAHAVRNQILGIINPAKKRHAAAMGVKESVSHNRIRPFPSY